MSDYGGGEDGGAAYGEEYVACTPTTSHHSCTSD